MRRLLLACLLLGSVHTFAFDRLQVEGYTLPNGLQLLLKPGTERGHVAIRLVVGVGLDDFGCEEKELPHLFEHLLFSGIDGGGEGDLEDRMQALGGEWNAYTSNADTTFVIEAPAQNQRKVLDLLLAILTRTQLTDAHINAAKRVVEREDGGHYSHLQRLLDRQDLGHSASNQLAVELGLKCAERAEVSHLTRDQLEKLRKEWYAPNNMTLIVVGDLDKLLPAYLERTYGQLDPVEPSEHRPLPEIQHTAASHRDLIRGWVGDGAKLHWLFPEPVLDDQHDETYNLLKDYLDWALYRQLRLKHGLSYGPWVEREVLGGVGFLSLNADLERENLPEAEQVLQDLKAQLLKDGLDPTVFTRLQQAAIARQAWAVQGNSALADYYWSAAGDYSNGRFSDPVKRIKAVSLAQTNQAMREAFQQPGYWRIEKPLLSYDALTWIGAGVLGLIILGLIGLRLYRKPVE
ncbi:MULTISPECIES: pitrilysin family protein [unclassified Pseudomonas]|uniref:M16 family metallopeptidase n=1 Tax=unclassified Pseudomonas TaxID=196821 RepID=UPI000C884836|nr:MULTISPECIES: pitrilysin family protein [unclassified Pseudomonas]MBJ2317550.1 insulinase family protein [Pseudomonas fluorescens]PMZ76113.1 insulinase family protein [Pseudomonas sp. GW247-3R2A]PMY76826.1 insulinase family protein [Pseudomonas sp. MPR-R3A]PMZ00323.1 insulinase family protein [Pseudomonas sp. FW305-124]PNA91096.1 insulinase family protein [Pseudomonas sp. FW300-E2]